MLARRFPWIVACVQTFAAGLIVGTHAAKSDTRVPPDLFSGADGADTARSLLEIADWKVEFAAQINVRGERERAEALFGEAFERKPDKLWNTLNAAGSYPGVPPQLD
jgi:hypothetical protein